MTPDDTTYAEIRLTAYALDELSADERAEVDTWLAEDAAARAQLAEISETVALIATDLADEPPVALTSEQRAMIMAPPTGARRRRPADRGWLWAGGIALAAAALAFLLIPPTDSEAPGPLAGETASPGEGHGDPPAASPDVGIAAAAADPEAPAAKTVQPPLAAQMAPPASPRLGEVAWVDTLDHQVTSYFGARRRHRLYVQVDKPLYRPGETIWIKTWEAAVRDMAGKYAAPRVLVELVDPKGAVVARKALQATAGRATNDFVLAPHAAGGEYTVRATGNHGVLGERRIIVANYEAPRIKKTLDFLRKAYGPGDAVSATVELARPTGEPVAHQVITGLVRLDSGELARVQATTNADGGAVVRFALPDKIEVGDGLLTVLVDAGGVTESITRRVPIVMKKLQLSFFPEGGDLVAGLPSRVYFSARNTLDKPAEAAGRIVDDHGQTVATFESVKNGLGRFDLQPATGRRYFAEVTAPVGITERYQLPLAKDGGCVLTTYDDVDGQLDALRAAVRCHEPQEVVVSAMVRDQLLDRAAVRATATEPGIVYLRGGDGALARAQGAARVTAFTTQGTPLAERLVYRNRRRRLEIAVSPDRDRYQPRDEVSLSVTTRDAEGKPVSAEVALAVVDDTTLSYADDKRGHILSQLFLEPELVGEVEEPNTYLDLTEPDSGVALDLLMGTQGYRRFAWQTVLAPAVSTASPAPPRGEAAEAEPAMAGAFRMAEGDEVVVVAALDAHEDDDGLDGLRGRRAGGPADFGDELDLDLDKDAEAPKVPLAAALADPAPLNKEQARGPAAVREADQPARDALAANAEAPARGAEEAAAGRLANGLVAGDIGGADGFGFRRLNRGQQPVQQLALSPVRVFPTPRRSANAPGPRNDFRDTVMWVPSLRTDAAGRAIVRFPLSDAVTSFRAVAEGVGGTDVGRSETVIASSLPFSMSVKLPQAVTSQDAVRLPLTLTNETDAPLEMTVLADLGEHLRLTDTTAQRTVTLAAKSSETLTFAATPEVADGVTIVSFTARAAGLSDSFTRPLPVAPAGFPQELTAGGELRDTVRHDVNVGQAIPGTISATVRLYPSPVASMVRGLEGLMREPHGCFEQASASNYPNVMVMNYLKAHEVDDAKLLKRSKGLLTAGYQKLAGYETRAKGYEWFGQAPGHEALTAYGLVQFHDMKAVHPDVSDAMVARTTAWLLSRRDGEGGFRQNPRALDSFGRASKEVTDAYIIWSLTEAGHTDLAPELAKLARWAEASEDAYILALTANALANVPGHGAAAATARRRLVAMQDPTGHWAQADHSITRSGGRNLHLETTSLAVLALLAGHDHPAEVDRAVTWMRQHRSGHGSFGTTQATVLTLKALTAYAEARRVTRSSGTIAVWVDGEEVDRLTYAAGHRGPLEIVGLGQHLTAGVHTIALRHDGEAAMPYTLSVSFRTVKPATTPGAAVALTTTADKASVALGETVRVTAQVRNTTGQGQPMALARVGLPGGLAFQTWQLDELVDGGLIGFYETGPREVVLYFRDLAPGAVKDVPLDLVAVVPGRYQASASSSYLYYTNDQKVWADGLQVAVTD